MSSTPHEPMNENQMPINYATTDSRLQGRSSSTPKRRCRRCLCVSTILFFVIAVACLVLGVMLPIMIDNMVQSQLKEQIPLKVNDSLTYPAWLSPPIPIYMQFWFFDVVNPEEVILGAKPFLRQVGPITYLEKRQKVDIVFYQHNSSVSYREVRTYHYVEEMSVLKEDENFTNVNIPLLVLGNQVRYQIGILHGVIELIFETFDQNGLFVTKSAKEILWGYEDPALKLAKSILSPFGIAIDPMVGIFYGKNGTDDGHYNVFTGSESLNKFVHLHTWNDATELNYWSSEMANELNGTDGSMFAPGVHRDSRLYVFSSDLCRSIYVEFAEQNTVRDVPVLLFSAPESVFADAKDNPANQGFCIPKCLGAGLLNMSTCQPQAPVVMSPPHFYQSAPELLHMVEGLAPSEDHRTELSVEPTTGLVLLAKKKLQINMAIEPVVGFPDMKNLPPVLYMPLLWLNESALVDEESANQLRGSVVLAEKLSAVGQVTLNIIGGLLLAVVVVVMAVMLFQRYYRRRHEEEYAHSTSSRRNLIRNEETSGATA